MAGIVFVPEGSDNHGTLGSCFLCSRTCYCVLGVLISLPISFNPRHDEPDTAMTASNEVWDHISPNIQLGSFNFKSHVYVTFFLMSFDFRVYYI